MVQAFVLIQTDSGKASEVARAIGEIDGVQSSEAVTGVRTLTCPVVRL